MKKATEIILIIVLILMAVLIMTSIIISVDKSLDKTATTTETPDNATGEPVWVKYGDSYYKTNGSFVERRDPDELVCTVLYRDKNHQIIATALYDVTYYISTITVEGETLSGQTAADFEYTMTDAYFINDGKLYNERTGQAVDSVRLPVEIYDKLKNDLKAEYDLCTLAGIEKTELKEMGK